MAVKKMGPWLYAALFNVLLPFGLVLWAAAAADSVQLQGIHSIALGLSIAGVGSALLILGMLHMFIYGGGLPMNAYPPPRFVERGIYALLPHPIYIGFVMICIGVSISVGSASGLWLVSPVAALGCAALVLGYERHDLAERFGSAPHTLLPEASDRSPSGRDLLASYLYIFIPWLALYEGVIALGLPHDAFAAQFGFENRLPVIEWSESFYFSAYVLTALAPLFAKTRRDLRRFMVRALFAMSTAFLLYALLPLAAPQRPFIPQTLMGRLLSWERMFDNAAGAFPSFHVIWAWLAAAVYASRWPRLAWIWRVWAALVSVSCVTTGQHPIADVLGGFATVALAARAPALWEVLRKKSERIANSWREWRIGPVRVINHGFYVGAGAFFSCLIAETFAGPEHIVSILLPALAAVVGAALWAQFIEGSPQLLRPFGFYGGLLGGTLGALIALPFGTSPWLVLAAFSAGGPWAQAMGRLRCLVQGCCHGRPAPEPAGIRYIHPRSRVCRMTAWSGVLLHPTPAYSILWNVLTALIVTRLWILHAHLHLIAGLYFILNGVGRFVEEAWRGEPQTPVFAHLRLYQWAAFASVLLGIFMTALGTSEPAPGAQFTWNMVLPAATFGILVWFAMGVDFPESNRRFSRLV
jgi:protein-S-isoprenylcysteine O-methyltransferase Ste14/membrane-associated phospholipid phosphatase